MTNETIEARRAIMWQLRDILEDSGTHGTSLSPDLAKNVARMMTQRSRRELIIEMLSAWRPNVYD